MAASPQGRGSHPRPGGPLPAAAWGTVVTIGTAGPFAVAGAVADSRACVGSGRADSPDTATTRVRLDGLELPDLPVSGWAPVVTVRTGDSLWSLAADGLPAHAGDARIDRTWRTWYAANRPVVGPDPDLLLPGQRLVPPPAAAPERTQP